MTEYIVRRILMLIPVLIGVLTIVFIVMRIFSPNPAAMMLGKYATGERIKALERKLGFDRPLHVQYFKFMSQMLRGDFGQSLFSERPVFQELLVRLPATAELALISIFLSSLAGISIGTIAAVNQNTWIDYLSSVAALAGISIPIFWLALMLINLFSVNLGWLPVSGRLTTTTELQKITGFYVLDSILTGNPKALIDSVRHIVLPSFSVAIISMAIIARMTRSSMLEVIREDYITSARSKGLGEIKVILKHALKNGLIPVITVIGLQLGTLLGGTVITEIIFSWPGVGSYIVNAIKASDYPVVQGGVVLIATVFVLVNLLVDIAYAYLDPRIRYGENVEE